MINARNVRLLSKVTMLAGAATLVLALSSLAQAQQRFQTPDAAVEALVAAARSGDRKTVVNILGPGSQELVSSGDEVEDAGIKKEFLANYDAGHRILSETGKPSTLVMGPNDWPFPIPIAQRDGQWVFDVAAGREEILARRIGRNELATIKAMLAYWATGAEGVSILPISRTTRIEPHIYGRAKLNDLPIRVGFDTGAGRSMMKLSVAQRAGATLLDNDASPAGVMRGIGKRSTDSYFLPFSSFEIGNETIKNIRLRVAKTDFTGADMLIGTASQLH